MMAYGDVELRPWIERTSSATKVSFSSTGRAPDDQRNATHPTWHSGPPFSHDMIMGQPYTRRGGEGRPMDSDAS